MKRRAGNVLVLVAAVVAIATAAAFLANAWVRRKNLSTHRFLHGEVALNLAQAALAEAEQRLLGRDLLSASEEAGRQLLTLPASRVDWADAVLCPLSVGLADRLPGGAAVGALAHLSRFEPLLPEAGLHGVARDPVEKRGKLTIAAEASYGLVTRRVIAERDVMVVNRLPPAVTRFVLACLGTPPIPDERLNSLAYDAVRRVFTAGGREAAPLVVRSSPEPLKGLGSDGELLPLAADAERAAEFWRRSGWIFLGGPSPWMLNLTLGPGIGNVLEEGGLLRRAEYVVPARAVPGAQERLHAFGFASGILDSAFFSGKGRSLAPEGTALLHLSGDARQAAPALALGRVYRRYLTYSKLRKGSEGPFESFVYLPDEEAFQRAGGRFRQLTGKGFEEYSRLMPQAVVEPYNRSYDHLVTSREQSAPDRPYRIDPGGTPAIPGAILTASRVGGLLGAADVPRAFFLYPALGAPAAPVRIGEPAIFEGDLDRLAGYGDVMLARVVCRSSGTLPASALRRFLRPAEGRQELALPGVLHLTGGDVELPALRVRRGGALVADGSIAIQGAIESSSGEPLSLVSLGGDIRVETSQRIQAALLAPKGRVIFPDGPMEVSGSALVGSLDNLPDGCARPGPRTLTWDPALDPFSASSLYRAYVSGRRQVRFERAGD